jgi:hypothetical protein
MGLLPRTTLHSDSKQLTFHRKQIDVIFKLLMLNAVKLLPAVNG